MYLQRGQILDHKNEGVTNSFTIDRDNSQIHYKTKDSQPSEPGIEFESTSFPLLLMNSKMRKIEGVTVMETNSKKSRYYTYIGPEKDTLELGGKSYDTWKITRYKRGDTKRTVTFWLAKQHHYVPLRIVSSKKGRDTVMTLLNPP